MYEVEYTDEFGEWWDNLTEDERISITASVGLLQHLGHQLKYPHSSDVKGSKHGHMRELRVQHQGKPYRILYAFDPRRVSILLIGGSKVGNDRWYKTMIPLAERLYDEHLIEISKSRGKK
ncbi:MAG: type II toxin-antitoxin system RelE/ParE family toxin [Gammaproteobacteria bacterium]|nr:type II toxin-antitoxin system RelE/ParE family toxin [Gammaproteobacteria bacterium]